ncbi:MAG: hypothetical protein JWQ83_998, partial [Lacunisphaera sp.]|nr:hypothetical protein [Lacunisphaera sp.]
MAHFRLFLVAGAVALLAGCQNLPDTQPFTDATVGLRSAVAATGTTVVAELKQTPLPKVAIQADNLEKAWVTRDTAMSALVAYASSLQAIVDSGKKGGESAKKLADAATTLTGSLAAANLLAGAGGTLLVDTFTYAHGQIAKARAAKSLEAALTEIQPAIERLATVLAADLKNSAEIVTLAIHAERDALAEDNQRELGYRKQLTATRGMLMSSVAADLQAGKKPAEISQADDLTRVSDLLAKSDAWNTDYEAKQAVIAARGRAAHE